MKIIVFAPFFPPDPTGSSVFAEHQVQELTRQGHKVLVVTNQPDRNAPNAASISSDTDGQSHESNVIRLPSIRFNLGKLTWNYGIPVSLYGFVKLKMSRQLVKFDADAVIIHSTLFDLSLIALWWSQKHYKKTIIVSHTALWHDNSLVALAMRFYGRRVLKPLVMRSKAHVLSVDKWTHENALSLFVNGEESSVIPVSINLGKMKSGNRERVLMKHNIQGGPIVVSLGHVVPLRNRLNLVQCLPLLLEEYPDLKVVVVGMVKDNSFLDLAKQLRVSNHLIVVGAVPHDEIKDYLAVADLETHDLNGLGLGITSVEAMDAGVPIVAWAVDDNYPNMSLRGFGESGFIDDGTPETVAHKIHQLLSDESYRARVVTNQRNLVDSVFSCESVTAQYLKLLSS